MKILVLNGGSSSCKIWFGEIGESLPAEAPEPIWQAHLDWSQGAGQASVKIETAHAGTIEEQRESSDHGSLLRPVLESLWKGQAGVISGPDQIDVVGHRIVHGGPDFRTPIVVTPAVREAIAKQSEIAPSHNKFELEAIASVDQALVSSVPQVAVFDTGFHLTLPESAYVYPGPYEWLEQGIRRYGFHGISHKYASHRAAQLLKRNLSDLKIVTCHLGNGCSLAAVQNGRSVDTTMGFTPLDGLMMGSRSGSLDPGILIYLQRHLQYSPDQLDILLNQKSGLKGISGQSSDMREIQSALKKGDRRAQLAFDVYAHSVVRGIGSMMASAGGIDVLVFTGGVGENSEPLRKQVCSQFEFLSLHLNTAVEANEKADRDIASPQSRVRVVVVHSQEEWEIARECYSLTTNPS